MWETIFGNENVFQRKELAPWRVLCPFHSMLTTGSNAASMLLLPPSLLADIGLCLKRSLRAIQDGCTKGEEFSENRSLAFLLLSQILLIPMIMMRWKWSYLAATFVGQFLATKNVKASIMLAWKVILVDLPALAASKALEQILAVIPGIEMLRHAIWLEYQYVGAFLALVSFMWMGGRLLFELPLAVKYARRQRCLLALGIFNSYYIWSWSCYALLSVGRGQLPVKLEEIIVNAFLVRLCSVVVSVMHQMDHSDGNLHNLHKSHHAIFSYAGFDCETESSLERAFLNSNLTSGGSDILFRLDALVFDSASHSYGLRYDIYHVLHHLNPRSNHMLDPSMYSTHEEFHVLSKLFKQDKFIDPSEEQLVLEKIQEDKTYARFGSPPLVQPSTIEKWIMWAVLAEPVLGQANAAKAGEIEQIQIRSLAVETLARKAGA